MVAKILRSKNARTKLIGVGGAGSAADVHRYLDAGAESVHIATAAMVNPLVAMEVKQEMSLAFSDNS